VEKRYHDVYLCSIYSNSNHAALRAGLSDTFLRGIPSMVQIDPLSSAIYNTGIQ
jgi:hypothetical protein